MSIELKCTLTDEELLEKCHAWIHKLCQPGGRNEWVMHIPVQLNDDPDILWCEALSRLASLRARVKKLEAEKAAMDARREEVRNAAITFIQFCNDCSPSPGRDEEQFKKLYHQLRERLIESWQPRTESDKGVTK